MRASPNIAARRQSKVGAGDGFDWARSHLEDRHDRQVAKLSDPELDGDHARQIDFDLLLDAHAELPNRRRHLGGGIDGQAGHRGDDGKVEYLGERDPELSLEVVLGLNAGKDHGRIMLPHDLGGGLDIEDRIGAAESLIEDVDAMVDPLGIGDRECIFRAGRTDGHSHHAALVNRLLGNRLFDGVEIRLVDFVRKPLVIDAVARIPLSWA